MPSSQNVHPARVGGQYLSIDLAYMFFTGSGPLLMKKTAKPRAKILKVYMYTYMFTQKGEKK